MFTVIKEEAGVYRPDGRMEKEKVKKKFKFSIRKKAVLMISAFALLFILGATSIFGRLLYNTTYENYLDKANSLAKTAAQTVDVRNFRAVKQAVAEIYDSLSPEERIGNDTEDYEALEEYLDRYSFIETDYIGFKQLRTWLRKMADANQVDCVYLSYVDKATEKAVYLVDSADEEDACPPGSIDPLLEKNRDVLTNPYRGFPAYDSDLPEYGWLVTAGAPVIDSDGEVIGYAFTDISMNDIFAQQVYAVLRLIGWLVLAAVVIALVGALAVNRMITRPLRMLSNAAADYVHDEESAVQDGFAKLEIRTGDEIEELLHSVQKMESDINDHIISLINVNRELSASRTMTDKMARLANKDALTGVRNKTSYDRHVSELQDEIEKGNAAFGIAMIDLNNLKTLNDVHGHIAGDRAIKKLASIVCDVFSHSPVFRIGGDEFAVLIMNDDYLRVEDLVAEFNAVNEKISGDESLEPADRISAAIGYSMYEKEKDHTVQEVFDRADAAMYVRKRAMKGKKK
ncbi:MAG: diguanylate cyclase [Clostridia bacterium]|nr:diguanylate cyclase [Clostridia bacterium]